MIATRRIEGLVLKVGPLGERDRLLTLLSEEDGITRVAVPGARNPKSTLAAASALTYLKLDLGGKSGLQRVRQLKVLHSYSSVGQQLETLAAAQAISELALMMVGNNDPQPRMLETVLIHLKRLENLAKEKPLNQQIALARCIQSCVHLLALGGYGLPVQECCRTGVRLNPPLGQWDWRCSLLPDEGFAIGSIPCSKIELNPSELALLQRLFYPDLPKDKSGEILGPKEVWLRLLTVVECWISNHLRKKSSSLAMLRESLNTHIHSYS